MKNLFTLFLFLLLIVPSVISAQQWTNSGTSIYNNNFGNVLMGSTTDAGTKFQITGNSQLTNSSNSVLNCKYQV